MSEPLNTEPTVGKSIFTGLREKFFGKKSEPTTISTAAIETVEQPPQIPSSPNGPEPYPAPTAEENGNGVKIEGVITDQKIVTLFFKEHGIDAQLIATDSFLDKSRDEYNSAWLTRELVQNFVDHNPHAPGTLNGVRFNIEDLPGGGRRFRIEGNWPFADPTGVLSPHSEKPEKMNTAGGNGIGLKQTAIRFLRDFGVQKFQIQGEGWTVDYRLAKAADVNREWQSLHGQNPDYVVKHDWLLGHLQEAQRTGRNAYIIETNNPEVIRALQQFPTLGVSAENPYLQNMDYQNRFGAIKWLPKPDGLEPNRGRLFINGQVMNYKDKGATAEDYWVGPEQVTIQLNNVRYRMSIDRPPLSPFDLGRYLDEMVGAMSKEDLVEQIRSSEFLWAGHVDSGYSFDRQGAFVVIEKLAKQLPYKGYDKREYQQLFGGKNYICWDRGVSENQIKELEKQGYVVCPSYMEAIGMPRASSKLSTVEAASNEAPTIPQYKREQFAQEYGMEVAHEDFPNVKDPAEFIRLLSERLSSQVVAVEQREGNPNTIRLRLKGDIPRDLLFHALTKPKEDNQKLLYLLRGIAAYGLQNRLFNKLFTSQGEFVTTFGLDYDPITQENVLLARNIKNESEGGLFIEVELGDQYLQAFQEAFRRPTVAGNIPSGITSTPDTILSGETPKLPSGIQGGKGVTTEGNVTVDLKPWTSEEERLYRLATAKDPAILTEEEIRLMQRHQQLQQQFGEIPITQPEAPELNSRGEVIEKEASMSEAEKARVAQMEAQLPGIIEVVNKLEELVPERKIEEPNGGKSATEKYLEWRQSGQFYGQLGENAGYLTGKHLVELINEQNQAEIAKVNVVGRETTPQDIILGTLQDKLDAIVKRMNAAEDDVNDFEIVLDPNERQLAQLGLLRLYAQLTTGVVIPNDLFIYNGTGSKGINLGQKAIGMHESLFNVKFTEALRTFGHEVAHNYPEAEDHGNMFRHALESVFVTMIDRVSQIASNLATLQGITQDDRAILDIQKEWDKLAAA